MAVDPAAQAYVRDVTKPYVSEMVDILVQIARNEKVGSRDRMKAAVRVLDYHVRGGSVSDTDGEGGTPRFGVVIVRGDDVEGMREASNELRRLNAEGVGK